MRQAWKSGPAKTWSCHQHWRDTFILKSRKTKCQQELHHDHTISTNTSYVLKKAFYQKLFITASTAAQSREVAFSAALLQTVSLAGLARSPGLCGPAGGTLTLSVEQPAATFSQVPHQPQLDPVPSHLRSNNPLTLAHRREAVIIPRWSRCRWNHTHIECNVSHWHLQKSGLFRPQTGPRYPAGSSTQSWEERGW